ncbi:Threonine/homoserine efflux transporter RhtA [Nocardioides exalbidus]|uniref:Threonine/homoserine efflux transporter RhtA n=1 Tax=Nocardioides exalbidus TaxID=402596 RepID=A0A1H4TQV1_9ACTN|nr:DMT family transporter [Nocardioides exalbidus]SEC58461.1 Threonine/homoserine efflux transporter RhtA [Nocardioides exalbidus]
MSRAASVAFVVVGLIWGTNFITMKWALESISAGQVTLLRVLFGFLPVLAYGLFRRAFARSHWRHAHHFVVMSVLATSLYYFLFAAGTELLPSGIAGALSASIPLFSFLGAAVLLRSERITLVRLAGVLTGLAGVVLIARPWAASATVEPKGVAFLLLGSASVGLSFVYARRFISPLEIPAAALTTYQIGLALVTLLLVTDLDGITAITHDTRATLGIVVGLGLLGTGVAFVLYYFIVERLGAVTAASATYIPPVVAVLIGWLLVGEELHALDGVAMVLILAGVVVLRIGSPRLEPPTTPPPAVTS